METSANVYKKCLIDKMINNQELTDLKKIGISMLTDLHNMCKEISISYSLTFGTLIGAVRHKGYIPWDDDIDVLVKRDEYYKLKKLVNEKYSNKYYIADTDTDQDYIHPFPKLIRKNTVLVEAEVDNKRIKHGVFIDLFLVDYAPAKRLKSKQFFYQLYNRLMSLECDFKFPSNIIRERAKENKYLRSYYRKRRIMGFFASIMPIKFWIWCRNKTMKDNKDKSQYVIYGDIIRPIPLNYMDELDTFDFEGKKLFGTKDYDSFLQSIYGDYMQLPPKENRERHIIVKLDLSKVDYDLH